MGHEIATGPSKAGDGRSARLPLRNHLKHMGESCDENYRDIKPQGSAKKLKRTIKISSTDSSAQNLQRLALPKTLRKRTQVVGVVQLKRQPSAVHVSSTFYHSR